MASSAFAATPTANATATADKSATAQPEGEKENPLGKLMKMFQSKAAVDACHGKSAGDACSFVGNNKKTIAGTCQPNKYESALLVCHHAEQKTAK